MDKPLNSFGHEESTEPDQWLDYRKGPHLEEVLEECPELALKLEGHLQELDYE